MTNLARKINPAAVIASVFGLTGFINLATGIEPIFELTAYLDVDEVPEYLVLSSGQKISGLLSVLMGLLMIALGKGLYEGRHRSWVMATVTLALIIANNLYRGTTPQTVILSGLLLVALILFRGHFRLGSDTKLNYAQVASLVSVVFALGYSIGGVYLMREEFGGVTSWVDAVYFTFVTFSTVGYGDLLPATDNAKIFVMSMIVIGLASFATALTVLLGPMIERQMKGVMNLMSRFQRMTNHVVVCGYSSVSESVIHELQDRGVPYLVMDDRADLIRHLQSKGHDVLSGDPTREESLIEANLAEATALITAFDSDSVNTLVAVTAKEYRDKVRDADFRIIVRVEEEENVEKVQRIGIDEVISPSTMGGRLMANRALELPGS